LEDARHSSVVYICKYFVRSPFKGKMLFHLVETRVKCHQLRWRRAAGGMRSCVRSSPPGCRAGRGRRAGPAQWRGRRETPTRTQPAPRRSPSPPAGRLGGRPAGGVGYSPGSGGQHQKCSFQHFFKGTVSRDFLLLIFFYMNQFPPIS
jgi:hypothetical protein